MPTRTFLWLSLSCAALLLDKEGSAQSITDGDTIKLAGTAYRLWGIDAPESKQTCSDGWPAGRAATTYMRELLNGHSVKCETRGRDKYGRTIGLCHADGVDIQAAMVSAGMAWAFTRYSHDYVVLEGEAQAAGLGIHAHQCQPAWEWRAERR
jgi:endonuclease YncB( thermonuclease family)